MKQLLIDCVGERIFTALAHSGKPVEFFIEPRELRGGSQVGFIFVGRIKTILPGQFAFVDIGAKKNAFINLPTGHGLKAGQSILVQVQKDAAGTKGMYLTLDISVKGRFAVLEYNGVKGPTVGISRKITDEKESRRLRKIVWKVLPPEFSAIVRTNAVGLSAEEITAEIAQLHEKFSEITAHAEFIRPPAQLFPAQQNTLLSTNLLSDIISSDLDEIIIHAPEDDFAELKKELCDFLPALVPKILQQPLNLKKQAKAAIQKEVRLPCGGYITVEQTEACAVIDVNTGSNAGNIDYATTVLETNLEAAEIIAHQLRLRNLSGIIIVDFIDMPKEHDKAALLTKLEAEIKKDRIKTETAGFIGLGMILLTRKKTRKPLAEELRVES